MSEARQLTERLRWLLDRLIVNGYHALPCRTCDSSGDIGVHDLAEMLREAADQIEADAERIKELEAERQKLSEHDWGELLSPLLGPDASIDQTERALAFLRIYSRTLLSGSQWDIPRTMGAALNQVTLHLESILRREAVPHGSE